MYGGAFEHLRKEIDAELSKIESEFNFEVGDEFEIALCVVLRKFLPQKYGICRGFAVNKEGEKRGDDIIIYDQHAFPTFYLRPNDFSRLELIPIEAIYAYLECKHNLILGAPLMSSSLTHAARQVALFKEICSGREARHYFQTDPYFNSPEDRRVQENIPKNWRMPRIRNPIFGAIFSRKVSIWDGKKPAVEIDPQKILDSMILGSDIDQVDKTSPDLVIGGLHNVMVPHHKKEEGYENTIFLLPENEGIGYSCYKMENSALSYGLIHLLGALDWMRLGRIKWFEVVNSFYQQARNSM